MSNNKESSVEWLINKLIDHQIIKVGQTTYGGKVNYKHEILLEQAKAMEKKQCVDFAEKAVRMALDEDVQNPVSINQLYNETFGGNK